MRNTVLKTLIILSITKNSKENSGLRRIVGGQDADEEIYPYIVRVQHQIIFFEMALMVGHSHSCTAAALAPTWTLTAAHCLFLKGTNYVGSIIRKPVIRHGPWKHSIISEIIYVVEHPAYRFRIFDLHNDIGLIKTEPLTMRLYGRVSALDLEAIVGHKVLLTGYGTTNSSDGDKEIIDDATSVGKPLQMLDVVVVKCDIKKLDLKPGMCVARRCGQSSGICPGDSGGPTLHSSGIIGINSIGPKAVTEFCALKSRSPIYDIAVITPTSPFVDWISDTIKNGVRHRKRKRKNA